MNVTVTLKNSEEEESLRHICLRAIVCREVKVDLIIGLPSILFNILLPLLTTHIAKNTCCEICMTNKNDNSIVPVAHILHESDKNLLNVKYNTHTATPVINANPGLTEWDFISDFRRSCAPQHRKYTGQLSILFNHISSEADTTTVPAYDDIDTMTATLQHLHMSELLHHYEDAVDTGGPGTTSTCPE